MTRGDSAHAIETEPGGGDPLGDVALVRIETGAGEVAGDRSAAARQFAVGVEPGKKEREVALSNPVTLGMELLERLRELVAELVDRPVRDRPG